MIPFSLASLFLLSLIQIPTPEAALRPNNGFDLYRTPRLRVILNGQVLVGAYEAEINSNNHYGANTFGVLVALGPDEWADAEFWSSETNMEVDVQLSTDGGRNFTSLIQGMADMASLDPIEKEVHIQGRDLTAALIEAQSQETFANRTASEIATIFAGRHGLAPIVTATTTPVGRFYESDHEQVMLNSFSRATSEWDLLVSLAQQENFNVFVSGNSLYFQPIASPLAISRVIEPADAIELRLERALNLAGQVQVTVKSWNTQLQTGFTGQVSGTIAGRSSDMSYGNSPASQYVLIRPNLTPDKALAAATQCLSEITRHERTIEFSMPGDLVLAPGNVILLNGTRTDFDQAYYIDSIRRTFRVKTGFLQHVGASNSSPRTITTVGSAS